MSHAQGNDLPTEDLSQTEVTPRRNNQPQSKSQQDELAKLLEKCAERAVIVNHDGDYGDTDSLWADKDFAQAYRAIQSYIDRAVLSGRIELLEELADVGEIHHSVFDYRIAKLTAHLERKI